MIIKITTRVRNRLKNYTIHEVWIDDVLEGLAILERESGKWAWTTDLQSVEFRTTSEFCRMHSFYVETLDQCAREILAYSITGHEG